MWLTGSQISLNYPNMEKLSVNTFLLIFLEEIGVDGQIIDHVTDIDLERDFNIKLRLHRVKIIEGIKKLQNGQND